MDTQIKLTFIFGTSIDGEIVKTYEPKVIEKTLNEKTPYNNFLESDSVVFSEHTFAEVLFESNDLFSVLEIESYDKEGIISLKPGESKVISPGEEKENMLVPGYYLLCIKTFKKIYNDVYKIEPTSIRWSNLMNIKKHLENVAYGLSYNIYKKKIGIVCDKSENTKQMKCYQLLSENKQVLQNNINYILSNPIEQIKKVYKEEVYSRRPDLKSQKWLSKKGPIYNSNPYEPIKNYEKHTILTKDTIENKWIKKIIHNTLNTLKELYDNFKSQYDKVIENLNLYPDNINLINKEKELKNILVELKNYRGTLVRYEYESWMKEITDYNNISKPSMKLLKDKNYYKVYNVYKELEDARKNNFNINFRSKFTSKKTSKLFEYYIVTLVIQILESNGFVWTKGWLVDSINNFEITDLKSETIIVLENEKYYCELAYDLKINSNYKDLQKSDFVNINSNHNTPDIRLSMFTKNNNKLKKATILEVKCRKKKYLIGERENITEQLKDYYNIGYSYFDENKNLRPRSNIIDNVIVICPKQDDYNIKEYLEFDFPLIQLEARENNIYGYNELKEEILKSLDL